MSLLAARRLMEEGTVGLPSQKPNDETSPSNKSGAAWRPEVLGAPEPRTATQLGRPPLGTDLGGGAVARSRGLFSGFTPDLMELDG